MKATASNLSFVRRENLETANGRTISDPSNSIFYVICVGANRCLASIVCLFAIYATRKGQATKRNFGYPHQIRFPGTDLSALPSKSIKND